MDKELERLEQLRKEAIDNPPKKKKGCSSCKKKKNELTSLEPVMEEVWIPTREDIKLAYAEFNSILGVKEDKKEFVSKVFKFLFGEELLYNCRSCKSNQAIKFHNYMKVF